MMRTSVRRVVIVAAVGVLAMLGFTAGGGSVSATPAHASGPVAAPVHPLPPNDSHYCDGCAPPLVYSGGPIADTTGATGLTITPIYWIPAGTKPYIAGYQTVINKYIADIAAASGSASNVYSVTPQYYSITGGTKTFLKYRYTAGTPIVDTQPFPASGCKALAGYTNCITDAQLRTELTRLKGVKGLTTNLANFYPVFTAPTVETQDLDGSNSASGFCGYHREFGPSGSELVYGNEVYEADGCGEGESPNSNIPADSAVSTLSHEIAENVTDPTDNTAWRDGNGAEIGDICGSDYGSPLGSTDPSNADTTEYNQVINGGRYYTQTEFSNSAYAKLGMGFGCQQSSVTSSKPRPSPKAAAKLFLEAAPSAVAADGSTTSDVTLFVTNQDGSANVGDAVNFSSYAVTGTGTCGTINKVSGKTNSNGELDATYTASKSNLVCALVAKDARAGKAATVAIYQGSYQNLAPTAVDTFPSALTTGKQMTFTTTFSNKTATPIAHAAVNLVIFPGKSGINVKASQLTLAYSTTGVGGHFTTLPLTGSTSDSIEATIGNAAGTTIGANGARKITYRLTVAAGAAHGTAAKDLFHLESYLDQVNPAAGTTSTIADTFSTHVSVRDAALAPTPTAIDAGHPAVPGAGDLSTELVGGLIALAAAGGLIARRRRRRSAHQH